MCAMRSDQEVSQLRARDPPVQNQLGNISHRECCDVAIAMIINTHTHFDHTGSNAEFGAVDRIVAHENAKASLMKPSCAPVTNCDAFKGDDAQYLPNVATASP